MIRNDCLNFFCSTTSTILHRENNLGELSYELDVTNMKKFGINQFFSTSVFLCLVSELLA